MREEIVPIWCINTSHLHQQNTIPSNIYGNIHYAIYSEAIESMLFFCSTKHQWFHSTPTTTHMFSTCTQISVTHIQDRITFEVVKSTWYPTFSFKLREWSAIITHYSAHKFIHTVNSLHGQPKFTYLEETEVSRGQSSQSDDHVCGESGEGLECRGLLKQLWRPVGERERQNGVNQYGH